ncbi:hypothetical protein JHK84_044936 [Glycine max]|nr:hypothetical protein JHK84_044936 [Glycine max]
MLLTLQPDKFPDSLSKKLGGMDELHKQAKGYIQMEEMFRFRKKVKQPKQKHDKREGSTKTDSHVIGLQACSPNLKAIQQEPAKPHPTADEGTQVMSVDERPPIQALIVYQASRDNEFSTDPHDDTSDRGLKPNEELI